jgi:chemotaxis protein MotB
MSKRRHKGGHDEEHVNHERWLLTYADMITLLMVLFIVMFAMSSVDSKKFEELKQSLAGAFGGSQTLVPGGASQGGSTDGISPVPIDLQIETGAGAEALTQLTPDEATEAVQQADRVEAYRNQKAAAAEVESLRELQQTMARELAAAGLTDESVQFQITERGLVVRVITSAIVFGGDSAVLLPQGRRIVAALAPALAAVPNQVEVSGHTNQLPVATVNYPSGWELSTARASSVVRHLLTFPGIAAERLAAVGYSDLRPLYPPSDPISVVRNRRVEVLVLSGRPAAVRALLETVAAAPAGTHGTAAPADPHQTAETAAPTTDTSHAEGQDSHG